MINSIKKVLSIASAIIFGSMLLQNCEPEADNLGEQFFNPANVNTEIKSITAYNISNNDSIRSDIFPMRLGVLGAFTEPVFGKQKASYVTQVRMAEYDPDFGSNAVVDSVVLVMNPFFKADSLTSTTNENYVYPDGNVPAKKVVSSYPIVRYGKHKIGGAPAMLNIRVHEVTDFLESSTKKYYSNQQVALNPNLLGSKLFNGKVSASTITKKSDGAELWKNDVSLRIPLDGAFFQNKIIAKKGSAELKDVANFIRYFKGIRLSVDENDGYLFQFNPDNAVILMYYKSDKVEGTTVTRPQKTFTFRLFGRDSNNNYHNVRIGQFEYDRSGTPVSAIPTSPNSVSGDSKLYLQGMGGPSAGLKISKELVQELKDKFNTEKAAIIGAKIRLYTDVETWSNSYPKPNTFTLNQEGLNAFLPDLSLLSGAPNYTFIKSFDTDKNPAYYEFMITKTLKDRVESATSATDLVLRLDIGEYIFLNNQAMGYNVTSRAYAMERVVLVGTGETDPRRAQLLIEYAKK